MTKLGQALGRRDESLSVNLVAIPTSAGETGQPKAQETPLPPSIAELRGSYWQRVTDAMNGLNLPANAKLLNYRITNSSENNSDVQIFYLAEREIDVDARELLAEDVKRRLNFPINSVNFNRVPVDIQKITFQNNGEKMSDDDMPLLDEAGKNLRINKRLRLEVALNQKNSEVLLKEKENTIKDYLNEKWAIPAEQIVFVKSKEEDEGDSYRIILPEEKEAK